jgi:putative ABC transport system substrate-binding protein
MQIVPAPVIDSGGIERAVADFAREPNGSLVVLPSPLIVANRRLIIELAIRHRLPAVCGEEIFMRVGGLMFYGPDPLDQVRKAAGYVDRILKGEKPGDLPVQQPTKFSLIINLKTAKAIGLDVPPALLARADEVIE